MVSSIAARSTTLRLAYLASFLDPTRLVHTKTILVPEWTIPIEIYLVVSEVIGFYQLFQRLVELRRVEPLLHGLVIAASIVDLTGRAADLVAVVRGRSR